jgi:S-(hydroxymethyl)glutathione dehydrogenase/alcohol dehydrogenase
VRGQTSICGRRQIGAAIAPWRDADGAEVNVMTGLGTMAELMHASERAFVRVETDLPFEQLSIIGCGVATGACAALRAAPVAAGMSVAVFGCGGVGISAIQAARASGAVVVIAADPVALKREAALRLGATHAIDPTAGDPVEAVRELTAGRGADVTFETAGRSDAATFAVQAARKGGTAAMVGGGTPDTSSVSLIDPKTVTWSLYGNADPRRDFPILVAMAESGLLDLEAMVSRRLSLDEVNDGFDALERGEVIRSVIVL